MLQFNVSYIENRLGQIAMSKVMRTPTNMGTNERDKLGSPN